MKQTLLTFALMLLPMLASAAVEKNGIYYNLNNGTGTAEVTEHPSKYQGDVSIPDKIVIDGTEYRVTSIGNDAFYKCSGLTSVTIPNGVTTIGNEAFEGCSSLTSITIPNSVTSIGDWAFSHCTGLTSITIPSSVTSIGDVAFYNCSGLTSITIPSCVTSIGVDAFRDCSGLTSIKVDAGNTVYDSRDNCNAIIETASNMLIAGCKNTIIPSSVTSIGSYAFADYSGLTSITIPNSVTSIGRSAFYNCSGLTSITIPSSVTIIADGAFSGCSGLASIKVEAGNTKYDSRDNCNAIIETASNTLIAGFKNTKIPSSVTSIGVRAFFGCGSLTSITIPNSVTSIESDAFGYCGSLTSVTIGNSVTSIGDFAFFSCIPLLDFYCHAENVPTTGSYVLDGSNIANATLHVPAGSVSAYQAAEPWNQFGTIVGIEETNGVSLDKSEVVIKKNKTVTLKATVTPETLADKSVTWKSSDTKIATVTSSGKVKGVKTGIVTITCTSVATGAKATCKVTVATITLNKSEVIVKKNKTVTLTPTVYPTTLADKSVKWKSSDKTIATVTSSGKVKGVKTGTATITCTSVATGLSATCKVIVGTITLNKSEVTVKKNKTVTLTPTVYPTTLADKSVTWKSSDETIATVASDGTVKGVKYGTATITCTSNATGLSTTCTVTVGTVFLNIAEVTIHNGRSVTLTPTIYPETLEDQSVTWKSSDKTVATVTSDGKVKGVNVGTATITCTSVATGLSSTCKVTVIEFAGARFVYEDDDEVTGIEIVEMPAIKEPVDVYDLGGRQVLKRVTTLDGLPAGVYIVNGKKMLKK